MENLEKKIGYKFKNIKLLKTALTHSSYANEHRCKSYERMEFLGDSVLGLVVTSFLYEKMKDVDEGDLSRMRAAIVCEDSLAEEARKIGLGEYIYLGNGEERSGSRERSSILSDVFEATVAAIYLDGGIEAATKYLFDIMGEKLEKSVKNKSVKDYKTRLQEAIQHKYHGKSQIEYHVVSQSGPEHQKSFLVELLINGKKVTEGNGFSKKEAEQKAAKEALLQNKI